jgi:hypothetical protein
VLQFSIAEHRGPPTSPHDLRVLWVDQWRAGAQNYNGTEEDDKSPSWSSNYYPIPIWQETKDTQYSGTGSNLDQERIDVCKQELNAMETHTSFHHSNKQTNKLYYHSINNSVLYFIYIYI